MGSVKAGYSMGMWNGDSGSASAAIGDCHGMTLMKYCNYNNMHHFTIKVTLYYFDGSGKMGEPKGSVVASTRQDYVDQIKKAGEKNVVKDGMLPFQQLDQELNLSLLDHYFLDQNGANFWRYIGYMQLNPNDIQNSGLPSDPADPEKEAKKGYRLIIEPVFSFLTSTQQVVHMTPKTMAIKGILITNPIRVEENSWRLHTTFDDVGIKAPMERTSDLRLIASETIGYGMAMIDLYSILNSTSENPDIPGNCLCPEDTVHQGEDLYCQIQQEKKKGYLYTCSTGQKKWCNDPSFAYLPQDCDSECQEREIWVVNTKANPAVCTFDHATNMGSYWQYTEKKTVCDNQQTDATNDSSKGRHIKKIGDYCHLYCLEHAETYFPGNINHSLNIGTNFVWPTSSRNIGSWGKNLFSLKIEGTMSCQFSFEGNPEEDYKKLSDERNHKLEEAKQLEEKASGCERVSKSCSTEHCETLTDGSGATYQGNCYTEHYDCSYNSPYDSCFDDLESAKGLREEAAKLKTSMDSIQGELSKCLYSSYEETDTNIYHFQTGVTLNYHDKEYGRAIVLQKEASESSCDRCEAVVCEDLTKRSDCLNAEGNYCTWNEANSTCVLGDFETTVKGINQRTIQIHKSVTYQLPDDLYRYINKKTLKSTSYLPLGQEGNYFHLAYGNLPISFQAADGFHDKSPTYPLDLFNIKLGHNGQFSKLANKNTYTCEYKVTKDLVPSCLCPPGTKHENENLYCKIAEANQKGQSITCADGQQKWCDLELSYDYNEDTCPSEYACPNDSTINISSCVIAGKSYQWCADNLCYGKTNKDGYECPSNTPNWHMDITGCVYTKMAQGYTQEGAINVCEAAVCPTNGLKIIYRTIDLANPFPGKDETHQFPLLEIGDFNYDVKGRYPGTNWNSKTLVAKEILNNRGAAADKVYAKDVTPLYTITLDPTIIGKIRAYNSQQKKNDEGYSDFTLECKNGVSCLSKQFLRDILGNYLTGGTCKNVNHDNFYKCSEVKS